MDDFIRRASSVDLAGPEFHRLIEDVESLADREVRSASMLGRSLATTPSLGAGVLEERDGSIVQCLEVLRRWARELTPNDDVVGAPAGRMFGIFPRRDSPVSFARRWAGAQAPIEAAVARLRDALARLRADNAAIAQEQVALETQIATLTRYAELSKQLDEWLGSYVEGIAVSDPNRAAIVQRELLYQVRQRRTAILTQLTVATQGLAALKIIADNNRDLINAITTATTTTLGVLQTGATVRQALEMRRRLQEDAGNPAGAVQLPEAEILQRGWAEVGETLNQVERLRRRLAESAATLARADIQ